MKKNILILLPLLGIVFSAWNTPYINTDETLELKYGMSKSSVLDIIGLPLYVEKGWPSGKKRQTGDVPEGFCIAPAYNKGAYQVIPKGDIDAYRNRK